MILSNIFKEQKYKCPFCLYEFTETEAKIKENTNGEKYYACPNNRCDSTTKRPVCQKRLPLNFFKSDSAVISLVGGAGTGKTYFFIALQRILQQSELNKLGISGTMHFPDQNSETYYNDLWEKVKNGTPLEATKKDSGVEKRAFCLQVNVDRRFKHKTIYFSFFDNPGEGFKNEAYIQDNMNLHSSDAILFLFSPEQVEGLLPLINEESNGKGSAGASDNPTPILSVINNIINVLEKDDIRDDDSKDGSTPEDGKTPKDGIIRLKKLVKKSINEWIPSKISIPFALCLSKYDLIGNSIDLSIPHDLDNTEFSSFVTPNGKNIEFKKINQISDNIYDSLNTWSAINLKNRLSNKFSNYHLFGVQSINKNYELEPRGVSLPLAWILHQLKIF